MSKCKHLIVTWLKKEATTFAQWSYYRDVYKCKTCDRLFTLKEIEE